MQPVQFLPNYECFKGKVRLVYFFGHGLGTCVFVGVWLCETVEERGRFRVFALQFFKKNGTYSHYNQDHSC